MTDDTPLPLDDITEHLMYEMIHAAQHQRLGAAEGAKLALRNRVRVLIEEARAEGVRGGTREQGAAP